MRLLVCGCRCLEDYRLVGNEIFQETREIPAQQVVIIHGAAITGADRFASGWATRHHAENKRFPADWDTHGKAAGPIRNQQMLDEGKPERVLAFWDGNTNRSGTFDMIRRAVRAGVPVRIVPVRREGEA